MARMKRGKTLDDLQFQSNELVERLGKEMIDASAKGDKKRAEQINARINKVVNTYDRYRDNIYRMKSNKKRQEKIEKDWNGERTMKEKEFDNTVSKLHYKQVSTRTYMGKTAG